MKHAGFAVFICALLGIIGYLGYQVYVSANLRSGIFDVPASFTFGPQEADLKVVEFFSYDCSPCQSLHPIITEAVQRDGHVLYIPRPIPSDSPESVNAAILAYAAGGQDKFIVLHNALMANFRVINEEVVNELTKTNNIDQEKLATDIQNAEIGGYIEKNKALYASLQLNALPVFMLGKDMLYVPPADALPSVDDIVKLFNEARARNKP